MSPPFPGRRLPTGRPTSVRDGPVSWSDGRPGALCPRSALTAYPPSAGVFDLQGAKAAQVGIGKGSSEFSTPFAGGGRG